MVGLIHGGVLKNHLQLYGASQSISGFTAPLIFLYTLAIFKKEERLPKKMYLLLLFGLFGTWFSIEIFNSQTEEILSMLILKEAKLSSVNFSQAPLATYLYVLHAFENGFFILIVISMLFTNFLNKNKMKVAAFYLFLPLLVALISSFMIHVLDYMFSGIETQKYSGLTSLPVTILIYLSLNYKNKLLESSFEKNKKISVELEKHKIITLMSQMFVHDFRKPFSQMKVILSNMKDYTKDHENLEKAKKEIDQSIRSVNDMVDEVLQFSKKRSLILKPVSLFQTFRYVFEQLKRIYPTEKIQFHFNLSAFYMPMGENSSVTRTISNIIFNAFEAILIMSKKKSGQIFLETRGIQEDGEKFIEVLIKNDGPFIPDDKI